MWLSCSTALQDATVLYATWKFGFINTYGALPCILTHIVIPLCSLAGADWLYNQLQKSLSRGHVNFPAKQKHTHEQQTVYLFGEPILGHLHRGHAGCFHGESLCIDYPQVCVPSLWSVLATLCLALAEGLLSLSISSFSQSHSPPPLSLSLLLSLHPLLSPFITRHSFTNTNSFLYGIFFDWMNLSGMSTLTLVDSSHTFCPSLSIFLCTI